MKKPWAKTYHGPTGPLDCKAWPLEIGQFGATWAWSVTSPRLFTGSVAWSRKDAKKYAKDAVRAYWREKGYKIK